MLHLAKEIKMHFLVVDPNVAFATLLSDELERLGHQGDVYDDGDRALASARADCPDIAFLDMGLGASQVSTLGRALRSLDASVRLVIIPMNGEALPEDVAALSVQGTLPKPFFLPELPERIEQALAAPMDDEALPENAADAPELDARKHVSEPEFVIEPVRDVTEAPGPSTQPQFSLDAFRGNRERVEHLMEALSMDVGADGVILTHHDDLLTWVGRLSEEEAEALAQVVVQGWRSSAEVARILGQEQLRFEQSIAGGNYLLYAVSVIDAILAVPVKGSALLGLLRQIARRVAKQIATLCLS
jgi:DNA-binding response OmpR family regulator/predicted regulator of Ras-like GTPase activity (Roadblock/LC7/MglB family)